METMTEVRERPVLFSGPMVRAILEGRKTQTRRVVKGEALRWLDESGFAPEFVALRENGLSPYGYAGDRLWVREAFFDHGPLPGDPEIPTTVEQREARVEYRATEWDRVAPVEGGWRPSIHMPRWASRITLEITDVRVERVQAITREDAIAEGVFEAEAAKEMAARRAITEGRDAVGPREYFRELWNSINAKRGFGWNTNPWCWCLTFRVLPTDGAAARGGE